MSNFTPTKQHFREVLLHYFILKKSAAESFRLLVDIYGENAPSERSCREWFQRFRNDEFDVRDKEREGAPKKFNDEQLQALLDEDPSQTLKELSQVLNVNQSTVGKRLKAMGMAQKQGFWLPHLLTDKDIIKRSTICQLLYQRHIRKSFLHRIVTGDEKWIYFNNTKRHKSSPAVVNERNYGNRAMFCIWWDQKGIIYYELLNTNETITATQYREQLSNLSKALRSKRSEYNNRLDKVIFLHDNARSHNSETVKEILESLKWDVLPHPPNSPDLIPSYYHLFYEMQKDLNDKQFHSYDDIKNWIDQWITTKNEEFFYRGINLLKEKWKHVITNDGKYFE